VRTGAFVPGAPGAEQKHGGSETAIALVGAPMSCTPARRVHGRVILKRAFGLLLEQLEHH
jgi:hypothetical protein